MLNPRAGAAAPIVRAETRASSSSALISDSPRARRRSFAVASAALAPDLHPEPGRHRRGRDGIDPSPSRGMVGARPPGRVGGPGRHRPGPRSPERGGERGLPHPRRPGCGTSPSRGPGHGPQRAGGVGGGAGRRGGRLRPLPAHPGGRSAPGRAVNGPVLRRARPAGGRGGDRRGGAGPRYLARAPPPVRNSATTVPGAPGPRSSSVAWPPPEPRPAP